MKNKKQEYESYIEEKSPTNEDLIRLHVKDCDVTNKKNIIVHYYSPTHIELTNVERNEFIESKILRNQLGTCSVTEVKVTGLDYETKILYDEYGRVIEEVITYELDKYRIEIHKYSGEQSGPYYIKVIENEITPDSMKEVKRNIILGFEVHNIDGKFKLVSRTKDKETVRLQETVFGTNMYNVATRYDINDNKDTMSGLLIEDTKDYFSNNNTLPIENLTTSYPLDGEGVASSILLQGKTKDGTFVISIVKLDKKHNQKIKVNFELDNNKYSFELEKASTSPFITSDDITEICAELRKVPENRGLELSMKAMEDFGIQIDGNSTRRVRGTTINLDYGTSIFGVANGNITTFMPAYFDYINEHKQQFLEGILNRLNIKTKQRKNGKNQE